MTDDEKIAEAMARDLCIQDGHNPDDMRGGFNTEPIWKSWAPECRNFVRMHRAMLEAALKLEKEQGE